MIYISPGNRRMNIPTWSLPAGRTCPNSTPSCHKYCYAKKAEKVYKNPKESRERNLKASLKKNFPKKMIEKIQKLKKTYFRIHEAGDFYNQKYLDKWIEICEAIPEKTFLVWTQMYKLDWSKKPNNMIVYWTIWHDSTNVPKKGLKAYVVDDGSGKIKNPKGNLKKIRFCEKGKGSDLKCDDCLWCFNGKGNIKFKLH